MSDAAIRAEDLSKRFRIPRSGARRTLADRVRAAVGSSAPPVPAPGARTGSEGDLWALRHVDFEVARGEAVGVVGANGAGKSTLLKILSRITDPTEGRVEIRGRVASLLEVGTGFHPELTARENVYMNGAILGMRRGEIDRRFDEIVAFSGVEEFLDTPVKRFSSGMRVRLAFSVAAHLEPEILVVDEVLAVGDAAFQRRCLGRMDDVASSGRTVLFVSHDMPAVTALCSRALLLAEGRVAMEGKAVPVVERYLEEAYATAQRPLDERSDRSGSGDLRFTHVELSGDDGRAPATGGTLHVRLGYRARDGRPFEGLRPALTFLGPRGEILFACDARFLQADFGKLPAEGEVACSIPGLPLAPGRYGLNVGAILGRSDELTDFVQHAASFDVAPGDFFGTGQTTMPSKHGPFLVQHRWSTPDA